MAKQHFYSCVPARMSLFNKMDSYDTFSYSEGITRDFIEKKLALVYDNKPAKEDTVLIRDGKLPTVYCQFTDEEDTVIQSAVSFIKSDYTGERSSYMVHSLLLSDGEKKKHLESLDTAAFNPAVFKKDLSDFDLNSPELRPDVNYPEIKVPAKKAATTEDFVKNYDTGTIKRIIFSLISIVCGKTKALYLGMPSDISTLSDDCLGFLNGILQIFPYHMRKLMSFVTYVGDVSRFSGFKIKCITEETPAVPVSKGITIKMGIKEFTGVSDEIIAANAVMVDFFYGLLNDDKIRREFIDFCSYAVEINPALKKANMKTLFDLIFLFRSLSGFYEEKAVIPNDDAVYNFMAVYDKNREALKKEYRARAMDCLKRYPETHTAIPKNVFSKVINMYPDEPKPSKDAVMSVVLELIHTDAMRDKLFGFITQIYEAESAETKKAIMESLCSVYYGGFLQEKILDFFKLNFEKEPQEVRSLILEKLFLTIRTPKVQDMVLGFIDEFYDLLNKEEKARFYEIAYEMLPEGDRLSRAIADVIDLHIEDERKKEVEDCIIKAVSKEKDKAQAPLCTVLCTKCGFTESVIAKKVLLSWSEKEIFSAFVSAFCRKTLTGIAETVSEIWTAAPDMPAAAAEKIADTLNEKLNEKIKYDLFELIGAVNSLESLNNSVSASAEFVTKITKGSLMPLVSRNFPYVFEAKRYPGGIDRISELAESCEFIKKLPEYSEITEYKAAISALGSRDGMGAFIHLQNISDVVSRQGAAQLFAKELKAMPAGEAGDKDLFLLNAAADTLKGDGIKLIDAASVLKERVMNRLRDAEPKANAEALSLKADEETVCTVLDAVLSLCNSELEEDSKQSLTEEDSEFERYLISCINRDGKKIKKTISQKTEGASLPADYGAAVKRALDNKEKSGGLFKKLFGK